MVGTLMADGHTGRGYRAGRDVERRLAEADLPPPLADIVARTARRARLWPSERMEMAEELIAHFRDGLDAGIGPETLAATFGDPEMIGRLAGRAKRRSRPIVWRAAVRSLQVTVAVALLAYTVSAARLYSARPAVSDADLITAEKSDQATVAKPDEALDWSAIWPQEAASVAALRQKALAGAAEARASAAAGDTVGALERLQASASLADSLWARRSLVAELGRLALVERLVSETQDILGLPPALAGSDPEGAVLLESLRSGGRGLRTDVVAADFGELLNRLYSAGEEGRGRLTGQGLRRLRTLVGKRDPGLAAMVLEPVYFAVPASRGRVEDAAEEMFRLARAQPGGLRLFREGLAELLGSPLGSVRYIPLALVMPRIAGAMESERALRARLGTAG